MNMNLPDTLTLHKDDLKAGAIAIFRHLKRRSQKLVEVNVTSGDLDIQILIEFGSI